MPAAAGRPNARQARRSAPVEPPVRNPDLAHLDLTGLRAYRQALGNEEHRVSYWRRLVQARLDVVASGSSVGPTETANRLREVLADGPVTSGRTALLAVVPVDDFPPLPALGTLWLRHPVHGDSKGNAALARDLSRAESQLSKYRAALHRRLSAATEELIARYREEPSQCLTALPLPADEVISATA